MRGTLSILPCLLMALVACDVVEFPGRKSKEGRNYTVEPGDTLYSIAQREYGDPLKYVFLKEHNPWISEPERLLPGDTVYIPPSDRAKNYFNVHPDKVEFEDGDAREFADEGSSTKKKDRFGLFKNGLFKNIVPEFSGKTLFGEPVDRLGFLVLAGSLGHAFVQGFLLWIVATITFVRDVTLRKSLKAAFHTEMITLFTVIVLGGVAVLMIHIGTTAPGSKNEADILATTETFFKEPLAMAIGGFSVFFVYILLSLRYVPQTFGLQRARSLFLVFIAILTPHLLGLYTVGQRLGLIKL